MLVVTSSTQKNFFWDVFSWLGKVYYLPYLSDFDRVPFGRQLKLPHYPTICRSKATLRCNMLLARRYEPSACGVVVLHSSSRVAIYLGPSGTEAKMYGVQVAP